MEVVTLEGEVWELVGLTDSVEGWGGKRLLRLNGVNVENDEQSRTDFFNLRVEVRVSIAKSEEKFEMVFTLRRSRGLSVLS
jgi:hypothetical protein